MPRYKAYSYEQGEFISINFSRQILPESFEFALNYIVDNKMDVSVFEERIKNDGTGAPAYDPRILLKIVFYAYSKGITTSRDIEKVCRENVMFMALSANTRPHFTTIADFISSMSDGIEPLFLDVLLYCDQLGLIGKEMFAIDGCKISSNASKEWSGTRADFEKKAEKFRESIKFLLNKQRKEDERGEVESRDREKEVKAVENLEAKVRKIEEWLSKNADKQGADGKLKKSNVTDNESAKMVSSHGVVQGFNGVAAVDAKHQVIVAAQAHGTGSEHGLLNPMLDEVEKNLKALGHERVYEQAKITADSGFHSEESMRRLQERGIDGYVADNLFRKRDPRYETAGRHKQPVDRYKGKKKQRKYFGPDDFVLDTATGKLMCPNGKFLYVKDRNFKTTQGHYAIAYKAKITDCRVCPLRAQCLRVSTTPARQVYKFYGCKKEPSGTDWMKERIDSDRGRFLYSLRMGIVEPVFANIRDKLGLAGFTLRGNLKVNAQWVMYAIVHNMLKIFRYGLSTLPMAGWTTRAAPA